MGIDYSQPNFAPDKLPRKIEMASKYKNMHGFHELLFEYTEKGRYISVCALDPASRLEATVIGPIDTPIPSMRQLAARKLRMVVDKKRGRRRNPSDKTRSNFPKHTGSAGSYGKRESTSGWDIG